MTEPTGDGASNTSVSDAQRFTELFRANHAQVLAYCRRRLPHYLADDAVAETFTTAWRTLALAPDDQKLWLLGLARGSVANLRRRRDRFARLGDRLAALDRRGDGDGSNPPAPNGETYESSDSSFGAGEALHCAGVFNEPVSVAAPIVATKGLTAEWRVGTGSTNLGTAPAGDYVVGGLPISSTTVMLMVQPTPLPADTPDLVEANSGC